MAQTVKNLPAMQKTWVPSLGWEDPWRREWQPTPLLLPGELHGQRSLESTGMGCHALLKGIFLTQGSNPCPMSSELVGGNPSILAWEIPWTEKPGKLQSMRS